MTTNTVSERSRNWADRAANGLGFSGFPSILDSPFFAPFVGDMSIAPADKVVSTALRATRDDEGYLLKAFLPGVSNENLEVYVENGLLTVSAHSDEEDFAMKFKRTASLSDDVDADRITATLQHGVLKIRLPFLSPEQKEQNRKRITVTSDSPGGAKQVEAKE